MIKFLKIFILLSFVICLFGCGSKYPSGVTKEIYSILETVTEVSDLYLDGKLSSDEAYEEVYLCEEKLIPLENDDMDIDIMIKVGLINICLLTKDRSGVKEYNNDLKDYIGK